MKPNSCDPTQSLGPLLSKTTRTIGKRLTRNLNEAGLDITPEQWKILMILMRDEGRTQQELADCADKDKTTITRIVDGLERRNLVIRIQDREDRRIRRLYLTKAGRDMRPHLEREAQLTYEEALRDIPEDELRTCMTLLNRILTNLTNLHDTD